MDVYVLKEGRRTGPYQPFRLREMLEDGALTPLDVVWHEGMEQWQTLGETDSLRSVLRKEETTPVLPDLEEDAPPRPAPAAELTLAVLRARRGQAWRRFFARQIDLTIGIGLVIPAAAALGWTDYWSTVVPDGWTMLLVPAALWIVLEALQLHFLGWTPGRLVLGLRVERKDGGKVSLGQGLKRSLFVWAGGLGFGLRPGQLLPVAQWIYGFWSFQKHGQTLWDHAAGTVVTARPLGRWHAAGIAGLMALFSGLSAWLWLSAPIPERFDARAREEVEEIRRQFWPQSEPAAKTSLPSPRGA